MQGRKVTQSKAKDRSKGCKLNKICNEAIRGVTLRAGEQKHDLSATIWLLRPYRVLVYALAYCMLTERLATR